MQKEFDIQFQKNLLAWYDEHKRDLPFRKSRDPYHIWLSEIMAQQTTMRAVIPYYERFVKRFPKLSDVANASESELLTYWQGLGYYSRIRNFHKACATVVHAHQGRIPQSSAALLLLPGIGEYTANAIASICFDEPVAVIDANVKRVLARVFWITQNAFAKTTLTLYKKKAQKLLHTQRPGDFNQAMMELGAMVCRPVAPMCLECPVRAFCKGTKKNPESIPSKRKLAFIDVSYSALILQAEEKILLKKPNPKNLIRNMWELPSVYAQNTPAISIWKKTVSPKLDAKQLQSLGSIRHSITNKKITVNVFHLKQKLTTQNQDYAFVNLVELKDLPVNTLSRKVLEKFF